MRGSRYTAHKLQMGDQLAMAAKAPGTKLELIRFDTPELKPHDVEAAVEYCGMW